MEDSTKVLVDKIAELAMECGHLRRAEEALMNLHKQTEMLAAENAARKTRMQAIMFHIQDARERVIPVLQQSNLVTKWITDLTGAINEILTEDDATFLKRANITLPSGLRIIGLHDGDGGEE